MGPTLEETLASFLALYGRPSLFRMAEGWYSGLEVLVSGAGVQFKITSDYNHQTPREAVECCRTRLEEALRNLANPKTQKVDPPALACETTGLGPYARNLLHLESKP